MCVVPVAPHALLLLCLPVVLVSCQLVLVCCMLSAGHEVPTCFLSYAGPVSDTNVSDTIGALVLDGQGVLLLLARSAAGADHAGGAVGARAGVLLVTGHETCTSAYCVSASLLLHVMCCYA
jgi:hypothetical protein